MKAKGVKIRRRFTNIDSFLRWSKKDRLAWFDKRVSRLIENLSSIHDDIALYDDKGYELYNQPKETILAMAKAYREQLAKGGKGLKKNNPFTNAFKDFIKEVRFLTQNKYRLRAQITDIRMEKFAEYAKYKMSAEEWEEFNALLNLMSNKEKYKFTKSKYYFVYAGLPSEGLAEFEEIYGISLEHARLELFMAKENGLDWEDTTYGKKRLELGFDKGKL